MVMKIILTDIEIAEAIDLANGGNEWREGWELQDVIEEQDRSIARVQLKKVVENIKLVGVPTNGAVWIGRDIWQALLRECND